MPEPRLEPDDAIDRARDMVNALCKPRGIPGARRWILSIPARPDWDPDIVIMDGLRLGAKAMDERDALRAEVARLKAERRALVERAVRAAWDNIGDGVLLTDAWCERIVNRVLADAERERE